MTAAAAAQSLSAFPAAGAAPHTARSSAAFDQPAAPRLAIFIEHSIGNRGLPRLPLDLAYLGQTPARGSVCRPGCRLAARRGH